jgi:hypothetical protein
MMMLYASFKLEVKIMLLGEDSNFASHTPLWDIFINHRSSHVHYHQMAGKLQAYDLLKVLKLKLAPSQPWWRSPLDVTLSWAIWNHPFDANSWKYTNPTKDRKAHISWVILQIILTRFTIPYDHLIPRGTFFMLRVMTNLNPQFTLRLGQPCMFPCSIIISWGT